MGGERGLLWSYQCEPSFHLAAQTIHNGVGYRLTVHNEEGDTSAAGEVMTALLAGFVFTERLAVPTPEPTYAALDSVCGPVPPGPQDERLPWGEYRSANLPTAILVPTLESRGLPDIESTLAAHDFDSTSTKTAATTFCFVDGEFTQFMGLDGGPMSLDRPVRTR